MRNILFRRSDMNKNNKYEIPIWKKWNLTVSEASIYSNISENRLRNILNEPYCDFVLHVGTKRLIKRLKFERYIEEETVI